VDAEMIGTYDAIKSAIGGALKTPYHPLSCQNDPLE